MAVATLTLRLLVGALLLLSASCTGLAPHIDEQTTTQLVASKQDGSSLSKFAPLFILEKTNRDYNRIGTPTIADNGRGKPVVYVDPDRPTIYAMQKGFQSGGRNYTNLIYRVHFEKTPYSHLTGGKNVGLLILVTLDEQEHPLLITTVHTCGCYLGIVPTSYLSPSAYPEDWPLLGQKIYGEQLPSQLVIDQTSDNDRLALRIRSETHRVMEVKWQTLGEFEEAQLLPMHALHELDFNGNHLSFFETEGSRKGYVRNSHKPYERLLMSWWAFDWRIGEDKDLGPRDETGTVFYTSLKPWAREKSDLWEFSNFLKYWGWKL